MERRTRSIARLIDAAIAIIAESGYAAASASAIASAAGLSQGALFRHFGSMPVFMAAVAEEALDRQLAAFTTRMEALPSAPDPRAALRTLRELTHSPTNRVVYELIGAARCDAHLSSTLRSHTEQHLDAVRDAASRYLAPLGVPAELADVLLFMITDIYDAEAVLHPVRPLSDQHRHRRDALIETILAVLPCGLGPSPPEPA